MRTREEINTELLLSLNAVTLLNSTMLLTVATTNLSRADLDVLGKAIEDMTDHMQKLGADAKGLRT